MTPETWRFLYGQIIPLGDNRDLLHLPARSAPLVISSTTSRILQVCDQFATLEAHAERAQRVFRLSDAGRVEVEGVLRELVAQGALIPYSRQLARMPVCDYPTEPGSISLLAFPTRNRPEQLIATIRGWTSMVEAWP